MGLSSTEKLSRLRLIRSDNIGPVTFRQLLDRFGSAQDALIALPDMARNGGRRRVKICPLDTAKKEVRVEDVPVELTAYEYKVLEYLMLNPSRVVSKTELTDHLYEQDFDRDSNVIEVFVGRLRKKLTPINPIRTVRGQGYRFSLEATA